MGLGSAGGGQSSAGISEAKPWLCSSPHRLSQLGLTVAPKPGCQWALRPVWGPCPDTAWSGQLPLPGGGGPG